jgi:hypothetical protein
MTRGGVYGVYQTEGERQRRRIPIQAPFFHVRNFTDALGTPQ